LSEIEETRYEPIRHKFQEWIDSCRAAPAASQIPGYIRKQELADQLGVTPRTIDNYRVRYGIIFIEIGRELYCRDSTAQELADKQMAEAEAAAEPPRRGRPRGKR
jgi:hypothetical protein